MLENEGEIVEEQPNIKEQVDPDEFVRRELAEHPEILEAVGERKKRKFTRSGMLVILTGILLMALGILLHTGAYSIGGFVGGVGVLVVIVGICRFLIGLIKPIVPSQLR
jgi:hypothetical protein